MFGEPTPAPEEEEPTPPAPPIGRQAPPEDAYHLDDRCFVIACACVQEVTLRGHPVCRRHNTDEVSAIIDSGDWPGMYVHMGKAIVLHTTMRIGDEWPTEKRKGHLFKDAPSG